MGKDAAQRKREWRQRQREKGLVPVEVWFPEDEKDELLAWVEGRCVPKASQLTTLEELMIYVRDLHRRAAETFRAPAVQLLSYEDYFEFENLMSLDEGPFREAARLLERAARTQGSGQSPET